jgi:hypothetical protein
MKSVIGQHSLKEGIQALPARAAVASASRSSNAIQKASGSLATTGTL